MKKILFISNISNRITNFSIPSIVAAQSLGYDFYMAANYSGFTDDASKYNVKIHHIDIERNPLSFKNIKAYKQLLELIKEEDFDAIHCNTPIGGVLGRLCGRRAKTPKIIYSAHGFHFYKGAPFINNTLFKWAEILMAKYTDAIITMNKEDYNVAKSLKLRKNGNVYYIPGVGVDTHLFKLEDIDNDELRSSLNIQKDHIVIISMGDLIDRKNYEASIEAIAKAENNKIQFIICGKGPKLNSLQLLAKELGVENQIHFLGFRKDIHELLSIADIFLFTSFQEGLPRSMMEAMSAGLPCVVSKIRGNTDLIEEGIGGFMCNPNDIDGLARAIKKLANDRVLRGNMGKNNLEKIKMFDVENIKLEMKKIYEKEL